MDEKFEITDKMLRHLDENTLRLILDRSSKLATCKLEELRKQTDRSYTLFGLALTAFSAVTAFILSNASNITYMYIPLFALWLGLGLALWLLFSKVIWGYEYRDIGNTPGNILCDEDIDTWLQRCDGDEAQVNKYYMRNILLNSIDADSEAIRINNETLSDRVKAMRKIMLVIKVTVFAATSISLIVLVCGAAIV